MHHNQQPGPAKSATEAAEVAARNLDLQEGRTVTLSWSSPASFASQNSKVFESAAIMRVKH